MGDKLDEVLTALARIEQRQTAYERVAHRILDILEAQGEKLDTVVEAVTLEPEASPVQETLEAIHGSLLDQGALLEEIAQALRGDGPDVPEPDPEVLADLEVEFGTGAGTSEPLPSDWNGRGSHG